MAKRTSAQPAPLPDAPLNGCVDDSEFIPPKGSRKMYWVEIINRRVDPRTEEVIETRRKQCFDKRAYVNFQANAEKIGARKWRLIWNPEVYGTPE